MKKKIISLALAAMACISLAACGSGSDALDLKAIKTDKYIDQLVDYKNLSVSVAARNEVTESTVDYYIQDVLKKNSALVTEGTVKEGDVVNIDYAGYLDGVAFDGGTATDQYLTIGSGQFIDGFESGLVGVAVGETVDLNLTFPENYQASDLAGKEVVFTVTVNGILGELTDELVATLDEDVTTVAEYRELVNSFLNEYADYIYESDVREALADQLVSGTTFKELSDDLIARFEAPLRETYQKEADEAGMEFAEYMSSYYNITDTDSVFHEAAVSCAKEGLVLQAIANAEGLNVEDADLDESIEAFVESSDDFQNSEEFLEAQDRELTRENIMYTKVYDYLMGVVTITNE
ncbi:MAG: trigger factor [Lachnospiraceae bacterium]|nr:trigger factor [Lachnospiraceae bacterium]